MKLELCCLIIYFLSANVFGLHANTMFEILSLFGKTLFFVRAQGDKVVVNKDQLDIYVTKSSIQASSDDLVEQASQDPRTSSSFKQQIHELCERV